MSENFAEKLVKAAFGAGLPEKPLVDLRGIPYPSAATVAVIGSEIAFEMPKSVLKEIETLDREWERLQGEVCMYLHSKAVEAYQAHLLELATLPSSADAWSREDFIADYGHRCSAIKQAIRIVEEQARTILAPHRAAYCEAINRHADKLEDPLRKTAAKYHVAYSPPAHILAMRKHAHEVAHTQFNGRPADALPVKR